MAVLVECEKRMKYAHPLWLWAAMIVRSFFFRFEKMVLLCVFETFCLKFCGISSFIFIVFHFFGHFDRTGVLGMSKPEKKQQCTSTLFYPLVPSHFIMQISLRTFLKAKQLHATSPILPNKTFEPMITCTFRWISPKWNLLFFGLWVLKNTSVMGRESQNGRLFW